MRKKIKVERKVYFPEYGYFSEVMGMLKNILKETPEKYRSSLKADVETEEEYGIHSVYIKAYYYRPETKEEEEKRIEEERKYLEIAEDMERQVYKRLKKKYEKGGK